MAVSQEEAAETIPVLWMDDQPRAIKNYKRLLQEESSPLRVDIATSIAEARTKLHKELYGAVVIDCKMDRFGRTSNGAQFLLEINRDWPPLPTFVFTGFADDPVYSTHLERSAAVSVVSKTESFDLPLSDNPLFRDLREHGERYLKVARVQPEKLSFAQYITNPDVFQDLLDAHWPRHGVWISREMERRGLTWCVVCGDQLFAGSEDLFEFPDEDRLLQIGRETNLVPFAYTVPLMPEETVPEGVGRQVPVPAKGRVGAHDWAPTTLSGDLYPTLSVKVGSREITADFDTGAHITVLPVDMVGKHIFTAWREHHHLGKTYQYHARKLEIELRSSLGLERKGKLPVWVVKNWESSPFVQINPRRSALIGRDIMRLFDLVVCLCSRDGCTGVYFHDELPA